MLKGIDARLSAEMLYTLKAMGHGDTLVIADTNFPSYSVAAETINGTPLLMPNLTSGEVAEAILSVMPLDTFVDDFAMRMEVVGDADQIPDVQQEVQAAINAAEGAPRPMLSVDRFAFYEHTQSSCRGSGGFMAALSCARA